MIIGCGLRAPQGPDSIVRYLGEKGNWVLIIPSLPRVCRGTLMSEVSCISLKIPRCAFIEILNVLNPIYEFSRRFRDVRRLGSDFREARRISKAHQPGASKKPGASEKQRISGTPLGRPSGAGESQHHHHQPSINTPNPPRNNPRPASMLDNQDISVAYSVGVSVFATSWGPRVTHIGPHCPGTSFKTLRRTPHIVACSDNYTSEIPETTRTIRGKPL